MTTAPSTPVNAIDSSALDDLPSDARLLIIQYGDYGEAVRRFEEEGEEDYFAQRYTVDFVARLASRLARVTVLSCSIDESPARTSTGVYTAGVRLYPDRGRPRYRRLIRAAAQERPTHLLLATPIAPVLFWALYSRVRTLPIFADSFTRSGLKDRLRNFLLAKALNRPSIEWVANHNLAASLDLYRIGVTPGKILPFDWPAMFTPEQYAAKQAPGADPFRLIYVGAVVESKGVRDAILAIEQLRGQGRTVELDIVGGHDEPLERFVRDRGLQDYVTFQGRLPHTQIVSVMRQHDAVVAPSRHEYPEGLPFTIYEGLCSRSPAIVSDHPMFKVRMRDGENCVMFAAGKPEALAAAVLRLADDAALYARLSQHADQAAADYMCPLKWHDLILCWLSTDPARRRSLAEYSLVSGRYGDRLDLAT